LERKLDCLFLADSVSSRRRP